MTLREKQIQTDGVKNLKLLGYDVWNLSQVRASKQTAGLPDTFVAGHGECFWIEWKTPDGRHPEPQRYFQKVVTENGIPVYVWRSALCVAGHWNRRQKSA